MSSLTLQTYLDDVRALTLEAGKIVMEVYGQDFSVLEKDDKSPVTEADGRAEAVIVKGLRELTPEIPIVAEEEVSAGRMPRVPRGLFWLVDPLDGTKEFIKRNGEFTVNIGLIADGLPVMGLVYAPAREELYEGVVDSAHGGGDAFFEQSGNKQRIRVRSEPAEGLTVVASRSHGSMDEVQAFLGDRRVASTTAIGSSLKICLVAKGEADLYPRLGPTMEWDTAAAHAVLRAAGGRITTLDGDPLTYGKATFRNPHFLAAAEPE